MRKRIYFIFSLLLAAQGAMAGVSVGTGAHTAGLAGDEAENYRELLWEDFSKFTAGSEERPSANTVNDALQAIPDTKTLSPGWQGVEIYQAGGMAYQGVDGRLFTPDIDLSRNGGAFRISFRMKLAPGSPEGWANVVHANISSQASVKLTEEWQTVTYDFTGGIKGDYLAIRAVDINNVKGTQVKAFIDDILVEVPDPAVESPDGLTYDGFDGTGFTAYWDALPGCDGYGLRLYTVDGAGRESEVPGDFTTGDSSFSFSGLPENWTGYRLQVRAFLGDKVSPWSSPVAIEGIRPPVMLPPECRESGFVAGWEPVDGAYSYELRTFVEHVQSDDGPFYLADTDFAFVHEGEPGNGETDVAFDEMPGWFFGCADMQDGYIGVQGAFAYLGYAAQIESPRLDLTSSGGKISVEFRACNDDARTGLAVALFVQGKGGYRLVDEHRVDDLAKNWFTVRASLQGGTANSILAIIPTRSGNVYVDDLKVWQNVKAGVAARRLAAMAVTKGVSVSVDIECPEGDALCYSVRTVGVSADKSRWLYSPDTELVYPFGHTGVRDVSAGVEPEISLNGRTLTVTGACVSRLRVLDMAGRDVATRVSEFGDGTMAVELPAQGIYIVIAGGTAVKVAVR